ncbi:MAG: hypothetical protein RLZZ385_2557 [Pseudomonadota bacterium]|jgi:Flp pilus assembly protein TadD
MSLVNNMLRDLDQRRKSSGISPATVNLTPVAESPVANNPVLLFGILTAAVLLVIVLGYFYLQFYQGGDSTQTLSTPISATIPQSASSTVVPQQPPEFPGPVGAITAQATEPAPAVAEATTPIIPGPATPVYEPVAPPVVTSPPVTVTESRITTGPALDQAPQETTPLPVEPSAPGGSAIVRNSTQQTPQERDALNVQNALGLFNRNDFAGAFNMLETYIGANRDAHQSRETYAKLLMSLGSNEQALRVADEGLAIMPHRPGYKKIKARLLMADNQFAAAAALLQNRLPLLQEDVEYHDLLATALLASRQYADATNIYSGLIRHDSTEGKWWYGLASAYEGVGDMSAASQAYNLALQSANLSMALRQRSQRRVEELGQ